MEIRVHFLHRNVRHTITILVVGNPPPPPTVPPVRHAGALTGSEQAAVHHRSVHQGCGEKVTAYIGRGSLGECG